jgi:hypothetical protein
MTVRQPKPDPKKGLRLTGFIYRMYREGRIGLSKARNALDRLATRFDLAGDVVTANKISVVYMRVR